MLAFYNPILLGRINARVLVYDTMFLEKITKGKKFTSIVYTDLTDKCIKLSTNIREKILKEVLGLIFVVHKKDPCETRIIIYNGQKVFGSTSRGNFIRTPNITMN